MIRVGLPLEESILRRLLQYRQDADLSAERRALPVQALVDDLSSGRLIFGLGDASYALARVLPQEGLLWLMLEESWVRPAGNEVEEWGGLATWLSECAHYLGCRVVVAPAYTAKAAAEYKAHLGLESHMVMMRADIGVIFAAAHPAPAAPPELPAEPATATPTKKPRKGKGA